MPQESIDKKIYISKMLRRIFGPRWDNKKEIEKTFLGIHI
jgi:hypothetical protein